MVNTSGVLNGALLAEKTICEIVSVTGYPTADVAKGTKITLTVKVQNNRNIPFMGLVNVEDVVGETKTKVASRRAIVGGMLGLIAQKEVEGDIEVDTADMEAGTHSLNVVLNASIIGIRGIQQDVYEGAEFSITA